MPLRKTTSLPRRPVAAPVTALLLGAVLLSGLPVSVAQAGRPTITSSDRTEAVASLLAAADTALAAGRPAEALGQYDRALRQSPQSPAIHYGRARALEMLGRTGDAAQAYRTVLRDDPDHAGAAAGLAGLIGRDDPEAGLVELKRLARNRPGDPYLAARIGTLEATLGRWDQAAPQFETAAAALPEDAAAQHNLAVARDQLGDKAGAVAAYERVLELPPSPSVPLAQVRARLNELRTR